MDASLGERIKIARENAGLKQIQVAERLGITPQTINRYEKGHRVPDLDFINQFVKLTTCNVAWLLTGEGQTARADIPGVAEGPIYDHDVMAKVVQAVEELIDAEGLSITPSKKARLITLLYEDVMEKRVVSEEITARVHSLLGLAT